MLALRSRLRRLKPFFVGIIVMMAAAVTFTAKADDWPDPSKWAGKYSDQRPNGPDFYRLASIRAALLRLVGEQFYRRVILQWTVHIPIVVEGNAMLVWGCKPHFCISNQVTTLVEGRKISVCAYYDSIPSPSEPVPEAAKSPYPPAYAVRLWYVAGARSPIIERNPADAEQCAFQSIEDFNWKRQYAEALEQ